MTMAVRGIEVIPELETFGHTRYITDKTEYQHLTAGKRTKEIHFNAINPLHEDTHSLMFQLIQSVARYWLDYQLGLVLS